MSIRMFDIFVLALILITFGVHQCVCLSYRQQIEDCESEIRRLKELLKKKEENERKYQGE